VDDQETALNRVVAWTNFEFLAGAGVLPEVELLVARG
jgi:hypothetical protein